MNKQVMMVLFLVALGVYYAYDQLLPKYEKFNEDIIELQELITTAERTAPQLTKLQREEAELERKLEESLSRLPSASEIPDLLDLIIAVFERVGIPSSDIGTQNVGTPISGPNGIVRIHPITIGSVNDIQFQTLLNLIHALRDYERVMNVTSFSFARNADGTFNLTTMSIETYSYAVEEE